MASRPASETARDALRLMASRRLAPTPDNYASAYHEIAGSKPNEIAYDAFKAAFAGSDALDADQATVLAGDILDSKWEGLFVALRKAYDRRAKFADPPPPPSPATATEPAVAADPAFDADRAALLRQLRLHMARTIEFAIPAFGEDDVKVQPAALELAESLRSETEPVSVVNAKLSSFNHRLSFVAEDQKEIRSGLLDLLRLVFENIGELSIDDRWLRGQIEALMTASQPPVNLRRLDDVRRRLREVITKQAEMKARMMDAQEEMKRLLSSFMERLSSMAELSDDHHRKMESCVKKIESAKMISDIAPAIQEALAATRHISLQSAMNRDELRSTRLKADEAVAEAAMLREALDRASASARHDMLTGALNRKGLEEAIEREVARAERRGSKLSIAFLDLDNFKSINDVHGHGAGDDALQHLAQVARESIRPEDSLARFGGEEFVILMPETPLEGGIQAMTRLQRTLTRRFFMAGNAKLVITFSAGVAELAPEEAPMSAIQRADQAMYQAKRAGKNKVIGA